MRNLPFPDGYFEEVLALDCVEHVPRTEQVALLKEFWRVLQPGGVFKGKTPNLRVLAEAFVKGDIPDDEYERKLYANAEGGVAGGDVHMSGNSPELLARKLAEAGFKMVRVEKSLPGGDWSNMAWRAVAVKEVKA